MKTDYAIYQIAFKILLNKKDNFLFLKSFNNFLDLPGGRADNSEGKTAIKKIISREIREELGPKLKYKLGEPLFQYRRYFKPRKIYILITVYRADYLSGDIKISSEHSNYKWINPRKYKLNKNDFYNEEEYSAFKEYFKLFT